MMPEQIEIYYKIVTRLSFFIYTVFTGGCFAFLCKDFFRQKKYLCLVGISYAACALFLYYIPWEIDNFLAYSLSVASAFLVMLLLERQNRRTKLYLTITFFALRWVSAALTGAVTDFISRSMDRYLYYHIDAASPSAWKWYFFSFCIYCLLDDIALFGLLFGMTALIRKTFVIKDREMKWQELLLLLLPAVLGMISCEFSNQFYDLFTKEIYESSLRMRVIWILNLAGILTLIVSTVVLYQGLKQKQEQEKENLILARQIHDMQGHMKGLEQLNGEIRSIRHDMGNHVTVMESLLEQKRYAEAEEYLAPLKAKMRAGAFPVQTGNPVADMIFYEKKREAEKKNLRFEAAFRYPEKGKADSFDISVLLTNGLDNAIEAAGEGGFVRVSCRYQGNTWLICMENSCEKKLVLGEDGLPETDKPDKEAHGFGMKNMKAVTEKYYGTLSIEQEDGVVRLLALLVLE